MKIWIQLIKKENLYDPVILKKNYNRKIEKE